MSNAPEWIVDCDLGIDDVSSLLIALSHPEVSRVRAITVVDGNVSVQVGVENSQRILALFDRRDIPIHRGPPGPLLPNLGEKICWSGHGVDGIGNFSLDPEYASFSRDHLDGKEPHPVSSEPAAVAMVRMVNEKPGELAILALGPLTNVAIAIKLDENFLAKCKTVVIMGGSYHAKGNSSRVAEFNFHCDPDAAHVVFDSATSLAQKSSAGNAPPKLVIMPWETTLKHGVAWEQYDKLVGRGAGAQKTKLGTFLAGYAKGYERSSRQAYEEAKQQAAGRVDVPGRFDVDTDDDHSFLLCDVYAALILMYPDAILSYKDWDVKIELSGKHTRGQMLLEWYRATHAPNARVVLSIDSNKLRHVFEKTFIA
ncbi:hypothetical protein HK101_004740 [Irineochytrium annulatum]|nr:hypothetical protein HK101_004740 [Irineochytrium annulatum]